MTAGEHDKAFKLSQVAREDIPRLTEIHVISCAPDNAIRLYFSKDGQFYDGVLKMLEGQVGKASWTHMKAVDDETGELASWASWHVIERSTTVPTANEEKSTTFDWGEGLASYQASQTNQFFTKWTEGRRHLKFMAAFTDPRFQRRGMAGALLKHGNQLADEMKLPIFVQASPFGYSLYEANEFHTIGYLDVDLGDWVSKGKEDDKGYGNYRYRFMLRLPKV